MACSYGAAITNTLSAHFLVYSLRLTAPGWFGYDTGYYQTDRSLFLTLSPSLGLENGKTQRSGAKRTYWIAPTFLPEPPDGRMARKPLKSLQPRAVLAVTCLLLLIALVAVLVVDIFEFFTTVDKREKKEAHVV